MTDIDSILHSVNFEESICKQIDSVLESWDEVVRYYSVISDHAQKLVNKIIRKQNEIHSRLEQKRPWAPVEYRVIKIDNLSKSIRLMIMDSTQLITDENSPLIKFEISRDLFVNAYDLEKLHTYFRDYEEKLASSLAVEREITKKNSEMLLRMDFNKAKEFYFEHKDYFEKLDAENEAKVLPFEKWKESIKNGDVDYIMSWQDAEDRQETLNRIGLNVKLDDELEAMLRHEYERYVQRVKMGIE